jgi:TonB family protein
VLALAIAALPATARAEAPRPIDAPAPAYPRWAVGSGLATEVELRVLVGRDGTVHRVQVVPYDVTRDIQTRSMRASFDSAAVRAVRGWRFRPATHAGRAVSAWWTVSVPFADPEDAAGADSSRTWIADTTGGAGTPEPLAREAPEWPAAVPYLCRGRVTVRLFPGPDGTVWHANVTRSDLECRVAGMREVVHAAAVRAALRWRYAPEDDADTIRATFTIPPPRRDVPVVIGCVRDSLSGRPRPDAEILGEDGRHAFGTSDDSGWFVLRGAAARASRLRARLDACNAGGFRGARPWKQAGDEITLYTRRGPCGEGR